jgi:flagellar basal-body rod protein FlgB
MQSLYLFNIASQQSRWLSARQALIAGNVANANTPGYKALDVEPFAKVLETAGVQMAADKPGHLLPDSNGMPGSPAAVRGATWDVYYSGNDVSLEQELLKSNEVNRAYSLNTAIVKKFDTMLISSAKGG